MAVRSFNGTSDDIVHTVGTSLSGMTHGTVAAIVQRQGGSDFRGLFYTHTSGGTFRGAVNVWENDLITWFTASQSQGQAISANVWYLVLIRKASGSAAPRFSAYNYNTQTWSHQNGSNSQANWTSPGAGGTVRFSFQTSSDFWSGLMAVRAAWSNSLPWAADATGDSQIEAAGLESSLQAWLDASPTSAWRFDQAAVTEDVDDLVGDAHQTSRSGTTVVTGSDPPDFVFDSGAATVAGVAVIDLGALSASVSGLRRVPGTAAVDLRTVGATASGTRTVAGSAATTLGALSATADGARTIPGAASADLAPLGAAAAGRRTVLGSASASLGQLSGTAAGRRTVPATAAADLGGLTAAATGIRRNAGQAAASFGPLGGEAAGSRTVPGAASGSFGALDASAVAGGTVAGLAVGNLGALAGTAAALRIVYGTAGAQLAGLLASGDASPDAVALVTASAVDRSTTASIGTRSTTASIAARSTTAEVSVR